MKPFRETELLKLLEETARSAPSRNLTNDGSGISPEPATTDNAFTSQNNVDAPLMDLSLIHAMTYGDREQLRTILDRFVEDTGNEDRKSVVEGESVAVRVDLGGRRLFTNKKNKKTI